MKKLSPSAAFSDPARRTRAVIWAGVAVLVLAAVVVVALGVTSTRWFCGAACHKVQDDTIAAYESSVHSRISCMACHMPVNSNPLVFVFHKLKTVKEVRLTLTRTYELPLNGDSELAVKGKEMGSKQCTQCHGENRVVTPSKGVLIDHKAHAAKGIRCTVCHNRVAHPEDVELTLADPVTGKPNRKHVDMMKMKWCFRCHTQSPGKMAEGQPKTLEQEGSAEGTEGAAPVEVAALPVRFEAPGECGACHPKDFELKPANHLAAGFYKKLGPSKGHAKMAVEDPAYCATCHNLDRFCASCHGLAMPHPKGFKSTHGKVGHEKPKVCANCHAKAGATSPTEFCDSCHHKDARPGTPWVKQHFVIVRQSGAGACFECHNPTYCARCHVRGRVD